MIRARTPVALAHDYLTQRGGAERVALLMAGTFPGSPLYTTLYQPAMTFPEFAGVDVRTERLNRIRLLRTHHRLALPVLAPSVSSRLIDADVLLTSSSGWAHGFRVRGRKVVYCHAPARWLYQGRHYLGTATGGTARNRLRIGAATLGLSTLRLPLESWDRRAAASADRYLANSTVTANAIRTIYGIEAEVVPPPPALIPGETEVAVPGLEPGYFLCVARLLPYKNVDAVIKAAAMAGVRLVVVGAGPDRSRLEAVASRGGETRLLGRVPDEQLRWLYRHCKALIAAAYEDYGLAPLEAAAFERPSVALRDGGFLDTILEGRTGVFFDHPVPEEIAGAISSLDGVRWDRCTLTDHVQRFSAARFSRRLQAVVEEELGRT